MGALALSATQIMAEEKVYRWVDKDGVVHFGDRSDGHDDAEVIELEAAPVEEVQSDSQSPSPYQDNSQPSYAQELHEKRVANRKEFVEKKKDMDALCKEHRERLEVMTPVTRVMYEQEDGSVIQDDTGRLDKIAESEAFIAENCDK